MCAPLVAAGQQLRSGGNLGGGCPGALSDSGKSDGEGEGLIALAAEVGGRLTLALHRG